MTDWDVAVVGAGPAGATAALAARRADPSARVVLLDRASFPRDKVCGDGIAPHAFDLLDELGVARDQLAAGSAPVTALRLSSPGGVVAARPFARPAYVVPRLRFDERIVRAAVDSGAVLQRRRVRTIEQRDGHVLIDGELSARVVVGADGAESAARRAVGAAPPRRGTVAVALRGYVDAADRPQHEQLLTMAAAHWPAYAWVFPVGDGTANVGYGELIRTHAPSKAELTERLRSLLPDLGDVELRGHRLPLTTGRPQVAHGGVLLAGDAASLINPLTGEGIYYAVLSGRLAGEAALTDDPARVYRLALRRALGRHLRHTDLLARLTTWPRMLDVGTAAARQDPHAFERLVEIGLGAGTIDARMALAMARRLPALVR